MADLSTYALTDLASVKESLGIASGNTSKDNLIIRKINQATDMIEAYSNLDNDHHFKETTYTNEEFNAPNSDELVLRARPVTTVSSLQARDTVSNQDDWTTIDTEDHFIDQRSGVIEGLYRFYGRWKRWRVTYTAGYSTIPSDLAEACVMLAAYLTENATSGVAVKRKQEGSREIEYFAPSQGESLFTQLGIDDALNKYKHYVI